MAVDLSTRKEVENVIHVRRLNETEVDGGIPLVIRILTKD